MAKPPTFEQQVAYIAVRISIDLPGSANSSIGTGFLYAAPLNDGSEQSIILLVSNKHVFINPLGTLKISLNKKSSSNEPIHGEVIDFVQTNFSKVYYEHPDPEVDLACVNVTDIHKAGVFYKTLVDGFLRDIDYNYVTQGSDVLFVGYPANRYDMINNLPLVRKGIISSVPDIDFNGRGQIVIDAQVYQGSSGSPVFVHWDGKYVLLGVVSQTMIRHSQLQTLPSALSSVGVEQVIGLGIVIKQRHIKELFDYTIQEYIRRRSQE